MEVNLVKSHKLQLAVRTQPAVSQTW